LDLRERENEPSEREREREREREGRRGEEEVKEEDHTLQNT